jgi:fibronectin type 3 domain-containing protein
MQRPDRRILCAVLIATAVPGCLDDGTEPTTFEESIDQQAVASLPPAGMSAAELDDAFRTYGDTSGKWNGGDSTTSVALPDGRLAWLFSDTFLGPINADGTRPRSARMIHNALVVQDGAQLVDTRTGGSVMWPASLVGGDQDGQADNAGYWVGDGTIESGNLKVLYNHYRRTGTGGLDIALTGTWLATFALPSLTVQSLTDLQRGTTTAWGSAIFEDGAYTYIYGAEFAEGMKFAHVARVPAGGLGGAWQYWTGATWSSQQADSARSLSGVGTAFAVQKIGAQYVLVTMEGNLVFNPTAVAYTASAPTGPFTGPVVLYSPPEPQPGRGIIVYDTRVHPELARPGRLLFSYNVNSFAPDDNYTDARLYRPRFVEVTWPPPVPDPSTLPAAPTNLTASVNDEGVVHLSWNASPGAARYWVYQQDMTLGQTHAARIPSPRTTTSIDLSALRSDHLYAFSVAAENTGGEGPRSAVVSITPRIPVPPAPTGVTAIADTTGTVTVSWSAVPRVWNYQVFRRDVTAGQTTFDGMAKLDGATTSQALRWLTSNHVYEFYVVAQNGGGPSAPSVLVRATVRYDLPPVPTGLTATSNTDGTIGLRWTASGGSGVWFWVHMRDLTAGETAYTRLALPITNSREMTAGLLRDAHQYEFAVSAYNGGGESALSATARATARYPVPPAPTNLVATPGDRQVALTWNATAPDHWYWLYQRDVTDGETAFTRLPLPRSQGTTMTAGFLTNTHTYEFQVTAIGPGGAEGPASAPVRATPNVALPGKPTNLTASPNQDGTIALAWTTPSANVWHWVYQRDATAGGAWQRLGYPLTQGTTFAVTLLTNGHTYEFQVAAINSAGDGPTSDVASATCHYAPPPAPTGLRASTDGDGGVDLNWTAPAPNVFYWIYSRDVTAGAAFTRGVYPTTSASASPRLLRSGHVYEFKVTAESQGGEGPASAAVQVTVAGGLPAAPTNLSAVPGDGNVALAWTASTTANAWYWIEYRESGGTWQRTAYPLSTCCAFTLPFLANGTTYDFRVRATRASGDSVPSNVVSVRPMPPVPTAPTGLTASAGDGVVQLSWTASSTSNAWYWIEYSANGASWRRLQYPVSTCCTFSYAYLANGTSYQFRIRATNIAGDSAPSNTVSARPMPPFPQPPSGLSATPALGKVTLRWTASPTDNVWYWIEFAPGGGGWQRARYPLTTCCTFTLDSLGAASYQFRIRATNLAGDSAPSNMVSAAMPLPPAPTGLTAAQAAPYEARLAWNPVAGADAYIIYHGVSNSTLEFPAMTALPYPVIGGGSTSFTGGYLFQPGIHFWAVAAVKYGREGGRSGLATMSPLMENVNYFAARWRYIDGGAPSGGTKATTRVRTASVDGGIVVARAFIAPGGGDQYLPISDGFWRTFNQGPNASARIHVAWDTGRGDVGVVAQKSCIFELCRSALPVAFQYSGADDNETVPDNYVWFDTTSGDSLQFHWSASNAYLNGIWPFGHIDTTVTITRSSGANYSASLRTDHFPSYEVYQYPHYTTNGFPETRTLVTCGQFQIIGLLDTPSERRTCP